jgi:peptidoglycan/xylan/chitin deacetylase (PgdA/CDA1 family)
MKTRIKKLISKVYGLTNTFSPSPKVRILLYHSIGTPVPNDNYGLYNLSLNMFKSQIKWLKESQIPCIPLTDMESCDSGVTITFDDGYANNLYDAAPILLENKIPFTVFITPEFINS